MDCSEVLCGEAIVSESPESPFGSYFVSTYPPFSQWSTDDVPLAESRMARKPEATDVPLGLYVHVPFCAQRCDYCYYLSYADKTRNEHRDYVGALLSELALYRRTTAFADSALGFVYFGGGTPSLLDEASLRSLLIGSAELVPWRSAEEVTFECAPRSATAGKLSILRDAGVTRLSLGVQSLDDDVLRLNRRVHLRNDVERAYERVRRVGFKVVNLDLIVGLPGESGASVDRTLEEVIAMSPDSVTIYQLEIPQNTPLFRSTRDAEPSTAIPSWPLKRARLGRCFARLEAAGYTTRSAYAAVRDPVRHRFVYQDAQYHGADLLGIGASAFSYLAGVHHQNKTDFAAYVEAVSKGEFPISRAHGLNDEERLIREFVLQLKLGWVDASYFAGKFGVDVVRHFEDALQPLVGRGWLTIDAAGVRTTRQGLVRIDGLLEEFYLPQHRHVRYS